MNHYTLWLIVLLSGCMSLGQDAHRIYLLNDRMATPVPAHTALPYTLRIESTRSTSYDDNMDLVFSRTPDTRGHYAYAQWSERPSTRMSTLLFNRITSANIYHTVLSSTDEGSSDDQLSTDLLACYHDAAHSPGQAVITLRAGLYSHHELMARRIFTQRVALKQFNAAGAAAAFNQAESQLLDEMVAWLMSQQANSNARDQNMTPSTTHDSNDRTVNTNPND